MTIYTFVLLGGAFVLFGAWMLKLYTITRAVLWLRLHGAEYREKIENEETLREDHDIKNQDLYKILDTLEGAQFWPFGVSDYYARRRAESSALRLWLCGKFCRIAFDGNWLALFTPVWLFLIGVHRDPARSDWQQGWWPFFVLALLPLLAVFLLCVESVMAYAKVKSYAFAYQMFKRSDHKYFDELNVILGLLGRAVLGSATAVYISTVFACAFKGDALVCPIPLDCVTHAGLFLQSIYFAVVTISTVGYGDIAPANPTGQLVALVTVLVSWSLITFALTSLAAMVSDQNAAPKTK